MNQQAVFAGLGEPEPPQIAERIENVGRASVTYRNSREILTKGSGFLDSYDYSLNPFVGCTLACVYCYAGNFSPTPQMKRDWGNWVIVKENAIELMRKVRPGRLDGRAVYMSSVTDAYQPAERRLRLTRGILDELTERHIPRLVVQTRSPLVTRDIDLFKRIEERGGRVQVNLTVTTDDEEIRRAFEPGCPSGPARMKAAATIAASGIQTAITLTPLLLVSDPCGFAESLLATGVRRFVIQGFHRSEQRDFVASTRGPALDVLAEKLGCVSSDVMRLYGERYQQAREILVEALPNIGEGKDGFRPPF